MRGCIRRGRVRAKRLRGANSAVKRQRGASFVVIDGKIKSQLRHEHYRFVDQNGDSIEVEIDDDVWRGVSVDENTLVRISGEIDKDFTKTTIDVKNIKILNSK